MDLEQYSLEELRNFIQTEEYDQLDELSKKTLGDYINKATLKVADHAQRSGKHSNSKDFEKAFDRIRGIKKATSKLTKESYESLGLLVQAIQEGNASNMSQLFDKIMLEKISDLVEDRKVDLANEMFNEEQIDELSKKTLGNYIKKSSDHARGHSFNAGQATANLNGDGIANFEYQAKKSSKRQKGMDKAVDRLTKK